MVNFSNKISSKSVEKKIHPVEIYNISDRLSPAAGPIRPVQEIILTNWFENFKNNKDVILKLHTGQGKTLIGLLILQSKLNEGKGPAIYLCPNKYLVKQTIDQAKLFGINAIDAPDDLPVEFFEGKAILVTSIQKLFNGYTKFHLGAKSEKVESIVIDDAHACIDAIRDSFIIKINNNTNAYKEIFNLFASDLENQGAGTYFDITHEDYEAFLPVPYWNWYEKSSEITAILSKYKEEDYIKWQWPIIKDIINQCNCIISGNHLEITAFVTPIEKFGSYSNASHRVFMSATINDDSFFLKSLGVASSAVKNPLIFKDEKWSGEKMILLPELIHESLNRTEIISLFAKPRKKAYGIVGLTPSLATANVWGKYGAIVPNALNIIQEIESWKSGNFEKTLSIYNRYDGIDLPDRTCRVLILDSKPYGQNLSDMYQENTRSNSDLISIKIAQRIEQGIGRAVRSEKDYCVVILTGFDLVRTVRSRNSQKYFSTQTKTQIDIGLEIVKYTEEEVNNGKDPIKILVDLVNQSLQRDEGWKVFYKTKMDAIEIDNARSSIVDIVDLERVADNHFVNGDYAKAAEVFQNIIDNFLTEESEQGWYLQEMAKYIYPFDKIKSNLFQIAAHKKNRSLLKPKEGMKIEKIELNQKRVRNLAAWVSNFQSYAELKLEVDSILDDLFFGSFSEKFEKALNDLAKVLGFAGERPDRNWKEGPDNLWCIKEKTEYIIFECKSEVSVTRGLINKDETKQMNNSIAWFENTYGDVQLTSILIIPTNKYTKGAALSDGVTIMMDKQLKSLVKNVRDFYNSLKKEDIQNLEDSLIQQNLSKFKLTVENLKTDYGKKWQKIDKSSEV